MQNHPSPGQRNHPCLWARIASTVGFFSWQHESLAWTKVRINSKYCKIEMTIYSSLRLSHCQKRGSFSVVLIQFSSCQQPVTVLNISFLGNARQRRLNRLTCRARVESCFHEGDALSQQHAPAARVTARCATGYWSAMLGWETAGIMSRSRQSKPEASTLRGEPSNSALRARNLNRRFAHLVAQSLAS